MQKALNIFAVALGAALLGGALHANFTVFDMAKDAMYITRGEFVGLERTGVGDKLTLRCDTMIKGELATGTQVTLEAFEPAPADAALGRDVIVGFNLINGKHYFLHHPFCQRGAFYFETDDTAADGLDRTERALRNFVAINEPHKAEIEAELRKRLQYQRADYEGEFAAPLINAWKAELLSQIAWKNTWASRDAAKALVDHDLFKGRCTVAELQLVGGLVPLSEIGSIGRAYMLELIRNERSAHPELPALIAMVAEETSQACVGKLSNLLLVVDDREAVLASMGNLINAATSSAQTRCNALQILQAIKDKAGLVHVHAAITAEVAKGGDHSKPVLRRAFEALKAMPDAQNQPLLETFLTGDIARNSWEMERYGWVAFAMIDSEATNQTILRHYALANNKGRQNFFKALLPQNKVYRELLIIHPES
ncbi:MAG: hypothetical protein HS108_06105 [Planctomycetes bacterium]|nr:hypothetical protein [Planctomycetota bacterium]MCL4729566.1 hypothetical protein [Planctomycetota bacterium]